MGLKEYRRKRNFRRTSEPKGGRAARKKTGLAFVIQKHDASHLHYDFRLEFEGVLKSWAVPKGPSLDPTKKRLAVQVEDHPLEYGSFEGTIPAGQYGGGTVLLWDQGTWEPLEDATTGFREGRLKFQLAGQKLQGNWALVRSRQSHSGKPEWLLFKLRDEFARSEGDFNVTAAEPLSVASRRNLPQIAADKGSAVWDSHQENGHAEHSARPKKAAKAGTAVRAAARSKSTRKGTKKISLPAQIVPELATLVAKPPAGDDWFHEIKFDGYRMMAHIETGPGDRRPKVWCETRRHQDWTARFPGVVAALEKLGLRQTILDGELVVLNEEGVSDFQALQESLKDARHNVLYVVFDLLFLDGDDLRGLPLEERKSRLVGLGLPTDRGTVRFSEHVVGQGAEFFAAAQQRGLEGIVSKRRDRPYVAGRSTDWLKIKCQQRAEFVIGGYTEPRGERNGFGALLLGYHEDDGLHYAGRVGTGFDERMLRDLLGRLKKLTQDKSPFVDFPVKGARARDTHWVEPKLVGQIRFSNWTRDKLLRQPAFQGLREDKPASQVTREQPLSDAVGKHASRTGSRKVRGKPAASTGAGESTASSAQAGEAEIAGVRMTHPDKVLYPELGLTKRLLAEYYVEHADWILPQLVDRPLSIVRCPEGVEGHRFFQKHPPDSTPDWLRRVSIREKRGQETYMVVDDVQGLVSLVQIGALEIHLWGSRTDKLEQPDRLIFDLDPAPDVPWRRVTQSAVDIRDFLADLGLLSFVKTSGGKGLHVTVAIERRHEWPQVEEFCQLVARAVERADPARFISNMSKAKRTGKIFVDYLRNQRGQTAVAPYSTRARSGAPVAVPIGWDELKTLGSADQFDVPKTAARLAKLRKDPWADLGQARQTITAKMLRTLRA